ncbi:hypothetical protein [Hymenobacter sp. YC55]|uniref:hypothetical protein n=1 Tax=Hymenobacter sp. YC55 TaxID=3034019 RepID=UPI0023F6F7B0|nr:hypothetical protein [Hymenobacter sp. YC55]MDF7813813.1 hypothetical protein [Hymenobacter sp. YC55]
MAQRQATIIALLTTTLLVKDLYCIQRLPITGILDKLLTMKKMRSILDHYFPSAQGRA